MNLIRCGVVMAVPLITMIALFAQSQPPAGQRAG
jgi:hypothetical protein